MNKCVLIGFVNAQTPVGFIGVSAVADCDNECSLTGFINGPINLQGFINCFTPPVSSGGAGGTGAIVDTGSFLSPQIITTNIDIPLSPRGRIYIQSESGVVLNPTIGNGINTQELFIVGTSDSNPVLLDETQPNFPTNIILSGPIQFNRGTILYLQWVPGLGVLLEVSRNEI